MHEFISSVGFAQTYLNPFRNVDWVYEEDKGFIVWRRGTGDNVELLHIRTFTTGNGYGRHLFYRMLKDLAEKPPYYSVFGFTRVSNKEAKAFYAALGFKLSTVDGLYKDGSAVMFWQSYTRLVELQRLYLER